MIRRIFLRLTVLVVAALLGNVAAAQDDRLNRANFRQQDPRQVQAQESIFQGQEALIVGQVQQHLRPEITEGSVLAMSSEGVMFGDRLELGSRVPRILLPTQSGLLMKLDEVGGNTRLARATRTENGPWAGLRFNPFPGPYGASIALRAENDLLVGSGSVVRAQVLESGGILISADEVSLPVQNASVVAMLNDVERSVSYILLHTRTGVGSLWRLSADGTYALISDAYEMSAAYSMALDSRGDVFVLIQPRFGDPSAPNYSIWRFLVEGFRQIIHTDLSASQTLTPSAFAVSADGSRVYVGDNSLVERARLVSFDITGINISVTGRLIYAPQVDFSNPFLITSLAWGKWQ